MEQKEYKILLAVVPSLMLILGILIGLTYSKVKVNEEPKTLPVVIAAEKDEELAEVDKLAEETSAVEEMVSEYISLGEFELTAYCPCKYCSGGYGKTTACGTTAQENHTIAVDPTVIPYGSIIQINGVDYYAEDCGGAVKGKIIDIYFEDHKTASDFGRQKAEIFIKK